MWNGTCQASVIIILIWSKLFYIQGQSVVWYYRPVGGFFSLLEVFYGRAVEWNSYTFFFIRKHQASSLDGKYSDRIVDENRIIWATWDRDTRMQIVGIIMLEFRPYLLCINVYWFWAFLTCTVFFGVFMVLSGFRRHLDHRHVWFIIHLQKNVSL